MIPLMAQKILIIDDEKDVAHLAAKRLRASGYDVASVFEAEGALEAVRQDLPDLILLDIWLPGISGIDLFREMRSSPEIREIPVVFFSADPSKESLCLKELGAEGFVRKPYDPSELVQLIRRVLASCRAA